MMNNAIKGMFASDGKLYMVRTSPKASVQEDRSIVARGFDVGNRRGACSADITVSEQAGWDQMRKDIETS
jgi:hypothetical protein